MTRATHRIVTFIVLVFVVCAGPWGCALKHPQGPQSPTDEVRAQLKTVGLPVAAFPPEAHVDAPTSGKGMGALKGAGVGLAVGATPGMAIAGSIGKGCNGGGELGAVICGAALVFGLGVAAAGGTIGALGGTVYGAVTAESGSKVGAAQAELKSALIQADVQTMLRDKVLEMVRDRSPLNFVAVDDEDRHANGQPIDYQALASTGVDTVLEVSVPRIGLAGESGINPPISLLMNARARLVRTADGIEMYADKFDYRGDGASKFLEWAADEAQMFRQEIERGTRTLAEDIVRLVFPAEPVRDSAPAAQSATLPSTPIESIAESPATSSELPSGVRGRGRTQRKHAVRCTACGDDRDVARHVQASGGKPDVSSEAACFRGRWTDPLGAHSNPSRPGPCRLRRRVGCGCDRYADGDVPAKPGLCVPARVGRLSTD